jgi:hypothetical protein
MTPFLTVYLSVGCGFYLGLSAMNPFGFVDANAAGLIRGFLLGLVFWPVGLMYQVYHAIKALEGGKDEGESH